jgi:hypothetical protein
MRTNTVMHLFNRAPRAGLAAAFAAIALAPVSLPQPAGALPKTCVIRTYYSTAELETEVGMRSSCPGVKRRGRTTQFVEVETIDLVPEGPGGAGGGGGLPCEFLHGQDIECNNLPIARP